MVARQLRVLVGRVTSSGASGRCVLLLKLKVKRCTRDFAIVSSRVASNGRKWRREHVMGDPPGRNSNGFTG